MAEEIDYLKIDIILIDVVGEEKKFTTLKSLSKFIDQEAEFWRQAFGSLSNQNPMNQLLGSINSAKNEINTYKTNFQVWDETKRQQQLIPFLNRVKEHMELIAFSMTPLAIAFTEICKLGQHQASSFWTIVTNCNNGQLQDARTATIEGAILGYEFAHQEESIIYKRRDSEKRALSSLRKTLSDKTDELIGETDDFKRDIDEWKTTSQSELATDRESYKNEQLELLSTSAENLANQLSKDEIDRETFFLKASKQLNEMEELYREKLRLEPAATYWKSRSIALRNAGRFYGAVMASITVLVGFGFAWLFYQWMTKGELIKELAAEHWQGVIMLGATVTMAIFLIRVLGKLTFSTFHLQRDAEERELLTYLYLALSEKGSVDTESRQVVLQSLFSRAETGLLAGDHGPTIPVAEVVQNFRSK